MSRSDPRYTVHTGDTSYYFAHGRSYVWSYLKRVFRKRISPIDNPYPGLVLRDDEGTLWKPELQVVLVPAPEPEEEND